MIKIGIHRDLNRLPISYKSTRLLDTFYGIISEFNKLNVIDQMTISKKKLLNLSECDNEIINYSEREINNLLDELTKSDTYEVKDGTLRGSIFVTRDNLDETITIFISKPFQKYIFFKQDIEAMKSAKNNEKMQVELLDYWDRITKEKKKMLLILEFEELQKIRNKYAKRLYALLIQFKKTGYFCMSIEDFKNLMEVPQAYTLGQMNANVINRAKRELEKHNLFEFYGEPKGKGRRKISKIEISFKYLGELYKNSKLKFEQKEIKNKLTEDLSETKKNIVEKYLTIEDYNFYYLEYLTEHEAEDNRFSKKGFEIMMKQKGFEII